LAGIYIHIPFCKQACHYCDFHFSTNFRRKQEMVAALAKEIQIRKKELPGETIETIYFGGGTPSVLENNELEYLIAQVYENYSVVDKPEITLEANPDDLYENRIVQLSKTQINRLSIGVQSFFEDDLQLMNRAHSSAQALDSLKWAKKYFENISIDLIYGIPGMDDSRWIENIEKAMEFHLPHISSYALTVEPKTALAKMIQKGVVSNVDEEQSKRQFYMLLDRLQKFGFINYEISNFGKEGFFSKNNTAYWQGKKYLGIGPSAHSYDGKRRGWNSNNNIKYLKSLSDNKVPITYEALSKNDRYNEYIMTRLRTIWGASLEKINEDYGSRYGAYLINQSEKYLDNGLLRLENHVLVVTKKGKFLVDGIAADLFMVNLDT